MASMADGNGHVGGGGGRGCRTRATRALVWSMDSESSQLPLAIASYRQPASSSSAASSASRRKWRKLWDSRDRQAGGEAGAAELPADAKPSEAQVRPVSAGQRGDSRGPASQIGVQSAAKLGTRLDQRSARLSPGLQVGGCGRQPLSGQDQLLDKLQSPPAQIVIGNVRHVSVGRPPHRNPNRNPNPGPAGD